MLAKFVRGGLATMASETKVERYRITDAGRKAIKR
jgi:hypothetical protein